MPTPMEANGRRDDMAGGQDSEARHVHRGEARRVARRRWRRSRARAGGAGLARQVEERPRSRRLGGGPALGGLAGSSGPVHGPTCRSGLPPASSTHPPPDRDREWAAGRASWLGRAADRRRSRTGHLRRAAARLRTGCRPGPGGARPGGQRGRGRAGRAGCRRGGPGRGRGGGRRRRPAPIACGGDHLGAGTRPTPRSASRPCRTAWCSGRATPARGSRCRSATRCSTWPACWSASTASWPSWSAASRWTTCSRRVRRRGPRCAPPWCTCSPTTGTARWSSRRCWAVDRGRPGAAVRRSPTTSTSTRRSTTRRTSAACSGPIAGRCRRTGSTCRSATTAARAPSWCRAPTSSARAASAGRRTPAADVRPDRRLDIEAEVGFVVGVPRALGTPVPVDGFARARVRRRAGQRLVRPRHPGVGVPAARAVPRQVVRHVDLAVGRAAGGAASGAGAGAGAGPGGRCRICSGAGLGASTSRWRCGSTGSVVVAAAVRRRCTGRRPSSSPT